MGELLLPHLRQHQLSPADSHRFEESRLQFRSSNGCLIGRAWPLMTLIRRRNGRTAFCEFCIADVMVERLSACLPCRYRRRRPIFVPAAWRSELAPPSASRVKLSSLLLVGAPR